MLRAHHLPFTCFFLPPTDFLASSTAVPVQAQIKGNASRSSHGMRLGRGGLRAESAKRRVAAVVGSAKGRRLAANARAAANERKEDEHTDSVSRGFVRGCGGDGPIH